MGLVGPRVYSCCNCRNHVAFHDDIISREFQARDGGLASLFSHAMNIDLGLQEDKQLRTGLHTVADVHCSGCQQLLGWKYERAYELAQKYKEGKFVFEMSKIVTQYCCNCSDTIRHMNVVRDDVSASVKEADTSQSDEARPTANVDQMTQTMKSLSRKVEVGFARIETQYNGIQERLIKIMDGRLEALEDNVKEINGRLGKFKSIEEERINEKTVVGMLDVLKETADSNFSNLSDRIDVLQEKINVMDGRVSNLDTEWVFVES